MLSRGHDIPGFLEDAPPLHGFLLGAANYRDQKHDSLKVHPVTQNLPEALCSGGPTKSTLGELWDPRSLGESGDSFTFDSSLFLCIEPIRGTDPISLCALVSRKLKALLLDFRNAEGSPVSTPGFASF